MSQGHKFQKGSTFMTRGFVRTRSFQGEKEHLSVLVTDAGAPPPHYLMLSFTTLRPEFRNPDRTCVIKAGDHPGIHQTSMVMYGRAEVIRESVLQERRASGKLRMVEPIADEILEKMLQGVRTSTHTKSHVRDFLDEFGA